MNLQPEPCGSAENNFKLNETGNKNRQANGLPGSHIVIFICANMFI
jgi:hypothetical protein